MLLPHTNSVLLFALSLSMRLAVTDAVQFQASSLQSGPDLAGSSFPSSIAYDRASHSIVIAGSTFGHFFSGYDTTPVEIRGASSGCFLATVDLGGGDVAMTWKVRKLLGDNSDDVPESCSSLIYHERHSKLVVAGHSERHGFMDELYNDALLQEATAYGFLLDIDVATASDSNNNHNTDPLHLVGGRVLQSSRVNYPLAVTSRASDSWIYVASQETDSVRKADLGVDHVGTTFTVSAEVDPMRYLSYVGNYRLVLSRYQVRDTAASSGVEQHLQHSLTSGWSQIYAIRDAPVHVAGIAEVGGVILVAGTTNGTSPLFGGDEPILGAGSLDGFLTKFNKNTGRPIQDHLKNSHRIQSLDPSHEWVAGMCYTEQDNQHVYIVGATEGKLGATSTVGTAPAETQKSVEAFVMKVNVETLEEVWIRQIGAHSKTQDFTENRAVACVIEGKSLWIAGIVQDGAILRDAGTTESYGNDDVFVAKLKAEDGSIDFVRQIGSTEDDSLAMRGALALDKYGNCIVVGGTYGNLYRTRPTKEIEDQPWISDVFVTIIGGANGAMSQPESHPEFKQGQSNVESSSHQGNTNHIKTKATLIIGRTEIVLMILMGLALLAVTRGYCPNRPMINRDVSTLRGNVIKYLHDFDVNDIDLKHSATGGWHCSYTNDLANGVNKRPPRRVGSFPNYQQTKRGSAHGDDPLLTVPLKDCDSGRSRTGDSLLMADGEMDGLRRDGLGNSFELDDADASQNQGYDGLVEAYNSSWEDTRNGSRGWGKDII